MRAYRFARRAFLVGVGGAFGLDVMLRNLEAAAQGVKSPPRFLLAHWPLGTMRYRFVPEGTGSAYVASPILQPFETGGLRNDMTIFFGFSDGHLRCPGGGGAEAGTPFTTTGCNSTGTRQNGGEGDDAVAGGPSFDQVFLRNVPGLQRDGLRYVNAICDARVDSYETSTQCLSYSYETREILSVNPGGTITEHVPLLPQLSPARQYAALFANFMPGGATPANQREALRALQLRKSVLDYALGELGKLKQLAPASESDKIESHAEAIRKLELQLTQTSPGGACIVPPAPAESLQGQTGNAGYSNSVNIDDTPMHQAVAEAHLAIITAAFQCDLLRVATFQFAPGTSHVGFKGMIPSDPSRIAPHQPMSHASIILRGGSQKSPAGLVQADLDVYEYMANVHTWYNQRMADWLVKLKTTQDVLGQNLLDYTVIPFVTERADGSSLRSPKPALLFGGGKLGLKHGTFQGFSPVRPQVDLYVTCAQALLGTLEPLSALSAEPFVQSNPNAAIIPGLWSPPV